MEIHIPRSQVARTPGIEGFIETGDYDAILSANKEITGCPLEKDIPDNRYSQIVKRLIVDLPERIKSYEVKLANTEGLSDEEKEDFIAYYRDLSSKGRDICRNVVLAYETQNNRQGILSETELSLASKVVKGESDIMMEWNFPGIAQMALLHISESIFDIFSKDTLSIIDKFTGLEDYERLNFDAETTEDFIEDSSYSSIEEFYQDVMESSVEAQVLAINLRHVDTSNIKLERLEEFLDEEDMGLIEENHKADRY